MGLLVDVGLTFECSCRFLGFEKDRFGGDAIGGLDDGERVVAIVGELAHAFAGLRVVVACAQLKDEEVFEAGGSIVGVEAICIALDGDVCSQGEDIGFGVRAGGVVGLAHDVVAKKGRRGASDVKVPTSFFGLLVGDDELNT